MKSISLYKLAVIVHGLNSLSTVVLAFPLLLNGPSARAPVEGVPQVVVVLAALLGVAGLISAYGAWQGQKWGVWLTIITEALNGLLALPGVLFAPNQATRMSAISAVVIALFVIVTLLRRSQPTIAHGEEN